ncbi:hypothetical protein KA071_02790 [Candidatus Gracilibacteria bacterium]|nr:hypothetical protein [Candidatus Gracilibacteria bacterium]
MTEIAKTFEAANITDQLRQLSLSDMSRLSDDKKTELLTAINSKLETLKKDKKNGNIAKAGTELRQILYDVRRLDLQKLIEKSETVQEVKSQLAALEGIENSLNTSDKAREAMGKMKISDDSPEGIDMQPGEIINAQKGWDISKALNGLNLSKATSEQLPALLNIIENISNTRYDLVYKEGGKIDSIAKEEGGPEKYLNVYSEFKDTFARLRNEADTNALKALDLRDVQNDENIGDKVAAQGLDTIQYDYQLKDGVLTRTNKTSKITDYRNDVANVWETQQERDARLAQEKIKEEEPGKIADIIAGEHATGDSIDASGHGLDPAYSYARTEDSITRTRDGKTDTWDTKENKWISETDQNTRIAKENETIEGTDEYKEKMRTIFEKMRSNPDVYSENDAGKETYEFNGQQLSLEGEEPNQYLTRVVDGKTEQFDIETGEWSEVQESDKTNLDPERIAYISEIDGVKLPEGEWTSMNGGAIYFRKGETLIAALSNGNFQENIKGVWYNREFGDLPADVQESAANNRLKYFQDTYGDYIDPEFVNGKTAAFRDIPLKQISRVDDWNAGNQQSTIEGSIIINMVNGLLKSKSGSAPKMGDLTLAEYNQFRQDPDSFAKSTRLLPQPDKKGKLQFVKPDAYGVDGKGYEYALSGTVTIKKPQEESKVNIDTVMITKPDGQFQSQREWLSQVTVTPGTEYAFHGMPDLRFKKSSNGDIAVYKAGEEQKPIETYANNKWEKASGKV